MADVQIKEYTGDRLPDMLDFERSSGRRIPNSGMHNVGIRMDI